MVTQAEISTRLGTARREGREEGRKEGVEIGVGKGIEQKGREVIQKILSKGKYPQEVADLLDIPLSDVLAARS